MRLRPNEIKIESTDPFAHDLLQRSVEIENLTRLTKNIETPSVISLNSPWGTGKTTFVRMWATHLEANNTQTVYFNAWVSDFSNDPLLAFLGEIGDRFKELLGQAGTLHETWSKTKKIGQAVARRGVPVLIKVGTAGILDVEDFIEKEAASLAALLSRDAIESYQKNKDAISTFRNLVGSIANQIGEQRPLVIFVDELDRCRPDYAISLLERMKHLFDAKGLLFVLSIDRTQLSHSIKAVYGQEFDANKYLNRFIDLDYSLLAPDLNQYVGHLFDVYSMGEFFKPRAGYPALKNEKSTLTNIFAFLANLELLTLREVEQLFARVNLVLRATESTQYLYPALLAILIVIRYRNRNVYNRFIVPENSPNEMIEHLRSLCLQTGHKETREFAIVEGALLAAKLNCCSTTEKTIKRYKTILTSQSENETNKKYAQIVLLFAQEYQEIGDPILLSKLVERIEMFEQFTFPAN